MDKEIFDALVQSLRKAVEISEQQEQQGSQAPAISLVDGDMPPEIDFSKGVRGKFFRRYAVLNVPTELDED